MSFLTIPGQEGLFATVKNDRFTEDDDEEDDTEVRFIPRCSPIPRKRGQSIFDETAEYLRIQQAIKAAKRGVQFADTTGGDLVEVKEFYAFDSDDEDAEARWEEEEAKYRKKQREPTYRVLPEYNPLSDSALTQAVHAHKVEVERLSPVENEPLAFSGIIRVLNISFHKSVYIRTTMDNWSTYYDYLADYVEGSHDGATDKFSFKMSFAPPYLTHGSRIEFVVRYETSDGDYWANNSRMNYAVTLLVSYEDEAAKATTDVSEIRGILKPPKIYSMDDEDEKDEDEEGPEASSTTIRPIPKCPIIIPEIDLEKKDVRPHHPLPPDADLPLVDGTLSTATTTVTPDETSPHVSSETTSPTDDEDSSIAAQDSQSLWPSELASSLKMYRDLDDETQEQHATPRCSAFSPFSAFHPPDLGVLNTSLATESEELKSEIPTLEDSESVPECEESKITSNGLSEDEQVTLGTESTETPNVPQAFEEEDIVMPDTFLSPIDSTLIPVTVIPCDQSPPSSNMEMLERSPTPEIEKVHVAQESVEENIELELEDLITHGTNNGQDLTMQVETPTDISKIQPGDPSGTISQAGGLPEVSLALSEDVKETSTVETPANISEIQADAPSDTQAGEPSGDSLPSNDVKQTSTDDAGSPPECDEEAPLTKSGDKLYSSQTTEGQISTQITEDGQHLLDLQGQMPHSQSIGLLEDLDDVFEEKQISTESPSVSANRSMENIPDEIDASYAENPLTDEGRESPAPASTPSTELLSHSVSSPTSGRSDPNSTSAYLRPTVDSQVSLGEEANATSVFKYETSVGTTGVTEVTQDIPATEALNGNESTLLDNSTDSLPKSAEPTNSSSKSNLQRNLIISFGVLCGAIFISVVLTTPGALYSLGLI